VQTKSVRDAVLHLEKLAVRPVGISPDSMETQKKFDNKNSLGFPLLSDKDHRVSEAYGVWQEKSLYGKKSWGVVRSSFIIDESGTIMEAWYKIKPEDTVPKALDVLK
jgi:thioredoxin-dependent peroxiredoxin